MTPYLPTSRTKPCSDPSPGFGITPAMAFLGQSYTNSTGSPCNSTLFGLVYGKGESGSNPERKANRRERVHRSIAAPRPYRFLKYLAIGRRM